MVELTQSFLLESDTLDEDHQKLADMVNRITQALDDGRAGECEELVANFINSTKAHFAREEALLVKAGYPNVKKHQDHHKGLGVKMDHMLEFAKMAGENQMAGESLRKELVFFLMDDVITTDMEFKNFIENKAKSDKA
jgi:hemerythrin